MMLKHVMKKSSRMSLEFAAHRRLRRELRLMVLTDQLSISIRSGEAPYLVLTNLIKRGRELIVGERFQTSLSFRVSDVP